MKRCEKLIERIELLNSTVPVTETYIDDFFKDYEKNIKDWEKRKELNKKEKAKQIEIAKKVISWNNKKDWPKVQKIAKENGINVMTLFSNAEKILKSESK